jgi:hypothetical protein
LPQLAAKLNWRRAAGECKSVAPLAAGAAPAIGDEIARKKEAQKTNWWGR